MSDYVEECRKEAKQYPGVTYDKERDRFVAQINIKGKRVPLGRFETAESAGLAYAKMREANPIEGKAPKGPRPVEQTGPSKGFLIVCADAAAEGCSEDMPFDAFVGVVWRYLEKEKLASDGVTREVLASRLVEAADESERFTIANFEEGDVVIFGQAEEVANEHEIPLGRKARREWLVANADSSPYLKDVFKGMAASG